MKNSIIIQVNSPKDYTFKASGKIMNVMSDVEKTAPWVLTIFGDQGKLEQTMEFSHLAELEKAFPESDGIVDFQTGVEWKSAQAKKWAAYA